MQGSLEARQGWGEVGVMGRWVASGVGGGSANEEDQGKGKGGGEDYKGATRPKAVLAVSSSTK